MFGFKAINNSDRFGCVGIVDEQDGSKTINSFLNEFADRPTDDCDLVRLLDKYGFLLLKGIGLDDATLSVMRNASPLFNKANDPNAYSLVSRVFPMLPHNDYPPVSSHYGPSVVCLYGNIDLNGEFNDRTNASTYLVGNNFDLVNFLSELNTFLSHQNAYSTLEPVRQIKDQLGLILEGFGHLDGIGKSVRMRSLINPWRNFGQFVVSQLPDFLPEINNHIVDSLIKIGGVSFVSYSPGDLLIFSDRYCCHGRVTLSDDKLSPLCVAEIHYPDSTVSVGELRKGKDCIVGRYLLDNKFCI